MSKSKKNEDCAELVRSWTLTPAATFGSSVRAKGILLEMRARLPLTVRKSLDLRGMALIVTMSKDSALAFHSTSTLLIKELEDIESLPVIPREIEDILTISTTERRRWLEDGRLPSAGTRTVKLRGRARQITFHVFDPRLVEDILDRGVVEDWREDDAAAAADNRRRAALKAKLTRSLKSGRKMSPSSSHQSDGDGDGGAMLPGWEKFFRDGLLR
jgi:hypothetical protein